MLNKFCHLLASFVMFKLYKLLHYKEIPAFYWMTLDAWTDKPIAAFHYHNFKEVGEKVGGRGRG